MLDYRNHFKQTGIVELLKTDCVMLRQSVASVLNRLLCVMCGRFSVAFVAMPCHVCERPPSEW